MLHRTLHRPRIALIVSNGSLPQQLMQSGTFHQIRFVTIQQLFVFAQVLL